MLQKWFSRMVHCLGFVFFLAGIWVLYRELGGHHFQDVKRHFSAFPKAPLLLAALCTALNYFVLTGYEWLGLRYLKKPLKYRSILFASFIANALGNNVGAVAFSGAAIRYRMYSSWGLSAFETAQIIAFYSVSFCVGLVLILGTAFLFAPAQVLSFLPFNAEAAHGLGILFAAAAMAYAASCHFFKKPFEFKGWCFQLPSLKTACGQAGFSLMDWMLASGVLYVLLPTGHGMSYPVFLSLFLVGQILGMVSQVPAGLGVFEAVLMASLSKSVPVDQLFVSLLYYRLIYYLLPLFMALLFLGVFEFQNLRKHLKAAGSTLGQALTSFAPHILSFSVFIAGAVLLFSGATPAVGSRLALLDKFLPLPAIEFSHFLGSLVGVLLLFLARGIQRRLDAAYYLTLILLVFGMIFSILKGFDYEEAVILFVMFLLIVPCRAFFYRKASLFGEAFSSTWIFSILMVVSASIWLGFFAFKHINYSHDLWWDFSLKGDASRFMRAVVGMVVFSAIFAMSNLLRTASAKVQLPTAEDLDKAGPLILASKDINAYFALMGDKNFLFSDNGKAFIMYAVHGKSWVVLGDPIGDEACWLDLVTRFRSLVDRHGGIPVLYEVLSEHLPLYLDVGFALIKIGEEARVSIKNFTLEGSSRKDFRNSQRRLEKEGVSFEVISQEKTLLYFAELKSISDAWLEKKNTQEKGFSLGFFSEDYLKHFPIAIMKHQGRMVAFANMLLGAEKEEMSIDLMRYDPRTSPNGAMDYLFTQLILWGQKEGYEWFNLGMAPLSGLENREFAPLWNKFGAFIFSRGEHFYNFEGLRDYKEKFGPVWRPKYIALPGGFSVPRVLADIASLNSGGLKGIFSK